MSFKNTEQTKATKDTAFVRNVLKSNRKEAVLSHAISVGSVTYRQPVWW